MPHISLVREAVRARLTILSTVASQIHLDRRNAAYCQYGNVLGRISPYNATSTYECLSESSNALSVVFSSYTSSRRSTVPRQLVRQLAE